jgi:hypothetical protein
LKNHSQEGLFSTFSQHLGPNLGYNKKVLQNRPQHSLTFIILAVIALLNTACSPEGIAPDTPTPTPLVIITATLPPTQTPRPSATPEPPSPTVPVAPVEGQTISQLNVRSAPSADSDLLGTVQIFTKVQIVGKDPTSTWWMIVYPESPTGTGWITAQFVQATNTENVPVFNSQAQQGTGNAPATVAPPEAGAGPTVDTGSVAVSSPASSSSLAAAFPDGDSAQSPAVSIVLSKASVRSFNYSSDISSPEGDPEDWVQFKLDGPSGQETNVSVVLNCSGSGALSVELIQGNSALQSWQDITCGHPGQLLLNLYVGAPYYLRISPTQVNNIQKYINYTLIVSLQ